MNPENLRDFLKRQGLNSQEFAEVLGVTHSAVLHWLDGKRSISRTVSRLCHLFDMQPALIEKFRASAS